MARMRPPPDTTWPGTEQELYLLDKYRRHLRPKLRRARSGDRIRRDRLHETSIDTRTGSGRRLKIDQRKPFDRDRATSRASVVVNRRDNHQAGIAGWNIARVPSRCAAWIRDRVTPAQSVREARPHVRRITFIARLRG